MRFGEVIKCFGVALAVAVLISVYVQFVHAGYEEGYDYDADGRSELTWSLWAFVEAHYTNDPLMYRFAWHWGLRRAMGWPFTWTEGNLHVWIIGHARAGSEDYNILYLYAADDSGLIMGPWGLYAACDTKTGSAFRSLTGPWWCEDPYASVCTGQV